MLFEHRQLSSYCWQHASPSKKARDNVRGNKLCLILLVDTARIRKVEICGMYIFPMTWKFDGQVALLVHHKGASLCPTASHSFY